MAVIRFWEVYHEDGADYGLTPPAFKTRVAANFYATEWNGDVPGHKVREASREESQVSWWKPLDKQKRVPLNEVFSEPVESATEPVDEAG